MATQDATNPVSIVSKKKPWADLNLSLPINGFTGDINPLKDEDAIQNAIKNLILTNFYDRPFQPEKAANLKGLLFEPAISITRIELRQNITDVLHWYEPRIKLINVDVLENNANNSWHIVIYFLIKEFNTNSQVELELKRLR